MNFSEALEHIKQGKKLTRTAWHGFGVFVYFVAGSQFEVNRAPLNTIFEDGTKITYRSHLDWHDPEGNCGVWTPNANDLLAEDWEIATWKRHDTKK